MTTRLDVTTRLDLLTRHRDYLKREWQKVCEEIDTLSIEIDMLESLLGHYTANPTDTIDTEVE